MLIYHIYPPRRINEKISSRRIKKISSRRIKKISSRRINMIYKHGKTVSMPQSLPNKWRVRKYYYKLQVIDCFEAR